jgi:hypothetical protein
VGAVSWWLLFGRFETVFLTVSVKISLVKRKSWRAAKAQNILGNPENFIVRRAHFGREL